MLLPLLDTFPLQWLTCNINKINKINFASGKLSLHSFWRKVSIGNTLRPFCDRFLQIKVRFYINRITSLSRHQLFQKRPWCPRWATLNSSQFFHLLKHCGATLFILDNSAFFRPVTWHCRSLVFADKNKTDLDNERPKDWQNVSAMTRFRQIEVLFQINYYKRGKENRRYIEFRYIEVPL